MDGPCLIVAVDDSPSRQPVIETAQAFALKLGAHILLLHALSIPGDTTPDSIVHGDFEGPLAARHPLAIRARSLFKQDTQQFRDAGLDVRLLIRFGHAVDQVLSCAEVNQPLMIIMGTHAKRGLSRVLSGSLSDQILSRSDFPVLLIRVEAS